MAGALLNYVYESGTRLMNEVGGEGKATMVRHTTSTLLEVTSLLGLRGPFEAKQYPKKGLSHWSSHSHVTQNKRPW